MFRSSAVLRRDCLLSAVSIGLSHRATVITGLPQSAKDWTCEQGSDKLGACPGVCRRMYLVQRARIAGSSKVRIGHQTGLDCEVESTDQTLEGHEMGLNARCRGAGGEVESI